MIEMENESISLNRWLILITRLLKLADKFTMFLQNHF